MINIVIEVDKNEAIKQNKEFYGKEQIIAIDHTKDLTSKQREILSKCREKDGLFYIYNPSNYLCLEKDFSLEHRCYERYGFPGKKHLYMPKISEASLDSVHYILNTVIKMIEVCKENEKLHQVYLTQEEQKRKRQIEELIQKNPEEFYGGVISYGELSLSSVHKDLRSLFKGVEYTAFEKGKELGQYELQKLLHFEYQKEQEEKERIEKEKENQDSSKRYEKLILTLADLSDEETFIERFNKGYISDEILIPLMKKYITQNLPVSDNEIFSEADSEDHDDSYFLKDAKDVTEREYIRSNKLKEKIDQDKFLNYIDDLVLFNDQEEPEPVGNCLHIYFEFFDEINFFIKL